MIKINTALSNEVFYNEGFYIKKIKHSDFKNIFSHSEVDIINVYDSNLKVIKFNQDELITNEVIGETFNEYTNSQIINIANEIKKIHSLQLEDKTITPFKKAYTFLGGSSNIDKVINILNRNPSVLHNDLVSGNILIDGDQIQLIDFEYSWYGNEIFDVASFITERNLSKEQIDIFVSQFNVDKDELKIVTNFLNEFWSLWAWKLYEETNKEIYKKIALSKEKKD